MKKYLFLASVVIVVGTSYSLLSCTNDKKKENTGDNAPVETSQIDPVTHGEYLVTVMGCSDCHSPKRMGANGTEVIPELSLSGYPSDRPIAKFDTKMIQSGFAIFYPDLTASAGPWGISFAANITPDSTGIGTWSEEQFRKALLQGKHKGLDGTRTLLPPMPWQNFSLLKNNDVKSIFTYLKSVTPVKNTVPSPISPDKLFAQDY